MNIAGRYLLLGAFVGAVGGFLLGAGPEIVHHFLPHLAFHERGIYPWPVNVGLIGFSSAAMFLLPGACVGGMVGAVVRQAPRRQSRKPAPPEADARAWPPAPQPLNPEDATE